MNEGELHMEFTEKELREQELAFEAVKEEMSRLNARFDGMIKEAGLSHDDLQKSLEGQRSPEEEKLLEQARAAQAGTAPADPARSAGRGRPGAVRI
jgi:hypothetical protein